LINVWESTVKESASRTFLALSFCAFALSGCATSQGSFQELGQGHPARPENCQVEIFKAGAPDKTYIQISKLNVHLEKTFFVSSDFESASKELKRQACLSGADAIINLNETSSSYLETKIYNVSGIGICYQK
jgi:hypothetical protein